MCLREDIRQLKNMKTKRSFTIFQSLTSAGCKFTSPEQIEKI